ncbi:14902_t:CDS:2 [Gigaspora margarita]|uniref:14902_t:CDS:1 n=1 Tax=Gigaspora margarita TaxID=4874 RepID=A0ABN7UHY6_GIGMA|nr:14902_t:CDS:2 [Gigaspora margarita]
MSKKKGTNAKTERHFRLKKRNKLKIQLEKKNKKIENILRKAKLERLANQSKDKDSKVLQANISEQQAAVSDIDNIKNHLNISILCCAE